ncbi:46056_t:CDS:10, partial [Gigaspora margarita]
KEYPLNRKGEITELNISLKDLEGNLRLDGFVNLETLYCDNNRLTGLDFLTDLDNKKLTKLSISDNDFPINDLTIFSRFVNLEFLNLGNQSYQEHRHNRFYGSLESLKDLTKLKELHIENTDINSGLEYLSDSIEIFNCFASDELGKKSKEIEQELRKYGEPSNDAGLELRELDFATYLKNNNCNLSEVNIEESREKVETRKLDISNKGLERNLDLTDFVNLEELNCSDNELTKINLNNNKKLVNLYCKNNKLTNLNLSSCESLQVLHAYNNHEEENINELSDISFLDQLPNPEKLKSLQLCANNISNDLTLFARFTNLEDLDLGMGNKLYGSLEPLKNLDNLKKLDIANTDIDSGLKYLPKSVEEIYCSSKERSESKVKELSEKLGKGDSFFLDDNKYVRKITAQQALNEKYSDKEKVTEINLSDLKFNTERDLTIVDFPDLKEIKNRSDNLIDKIKKVDIINCPKLNKLEVKYLWNNKELNVNNCGNLIEVDCSYNQLEKLDVKSCSKLENLICSSNRLTVLNLKELTNLKKLDCFNNRLTDVELSQNNQLEEINISSNSDLSELNKKLKENDNFIFHNNKFPGCEGKKRNEVTELDISEKGLVGKLDLSGFVNLENFNCSENKLTALNVNDCLDLKIIHCYENELDNLDLSNLKQLENFICRDNFLVTIDYPTLNPDKLTNLRIYNRFTGSLNSLKDLIRLESLHISNTDINEVDIEKLPESVREIHYSTEERQKAKLKDIKKELDSHLKQNLSESLAKASSLEELNISNTNVDVELKNLPKSLKVIYCKEVKKIAGQLSEFPIDEEKNISGSNKEKLSEKLKGGLRLKGFTKLEELNCSSNQLTNLDLSNCHNLKTINISNNPFTSLDFLKGKGEKEKEPLTFLANLEELDLEGCPFSGSLKPLGKMDKLEALNIASTNIDKGLEHLSENCKKVYCDKSNKITDDAISTAISLERLFVIRTRGTAVTGGVLAATVNPVLGGVLAAVSPVVEIDNYNELSGILKQVEVALKDLKDKVKQFLEKYDKDGDKEIDIKELTEKRKEFSNELDKVEEIVKAIKKLEEIVTNYRQGELTGKDETRVEKGKKEEVSTTSTTSSTKVINELSEQIKVDEKLKEEIKKKLEKEFPKREIVFLLKGKKENQVLVVSRIKKDEEKKIFAIEIEFKERVQKSVKDKENEKKGEKREGESWKKMQVRLVKLLEKKLLEKDKGKTGKVISEQVNNNQNEQSEMEQTSSNASDPENQLVFCNENCYEKYFTTYCYQCGKDIKPGQNCYFSKNDSTICFCSKSCGTNYLQKKQQEKTEKELKQKKKKLEKLEKEAQETADQLFDNLLEDIKTGKDISSYKICRKYQQGRNKSNSDSNNDDLDEKTNDPANHHPSPTTPNKPKKCGICDQTFTNAEEHANSNPQCQAFAEACEKILNQGQTVNYSAVATSERAEAKESLKELREQLGLYQSTGPKSNPDK